MFGSIEASRCLVALRQADVHWIIALGLKSVGNTMTCGSQGGVYIYIYMILYVPMVDRWIVGHEKPQLLGTWSSHIK